LELRQLALYIDHTNLKAEATRQDMAKLCAEAREYGFAAVCVNPWQAGYAARELAGSGVGVAVVVGFPLGANSTTVKVYEAGEAVEQGAGEIDLVINIGALKSGLARQVREEVARVRRVVPGALLKVILETSLLTQEEKRLAALLSADEGADMLKTSTGFAGGATVEDVQFLKSVAPNLGIKASGGIRFAAAALQLIEAGADRLGTSNAIRILAELKEIAKR
jgi:deoxyribose-phosphate aldolase